MARKISARLPAYTASRSAGVIRPSPSRSSPEKVASRASRTAPGPVSNSSREMLPSPSASKYWQSMVYSPSPRCCQSRASSMVPLA